MAFTLPEVPCNDPTQFCRLCFSQQNMHWVIRTNGTDVDKPFVETIGICTGLWLRLDVDFPCAVCRRCTGMLEQIVDFRDECNRCNVALENKRADHTNSVVQFYDCPKDRVFNNGSAKPSSLEHDPDFDEEPTIYMENYSKPVITMTKADKDVALRSYFDSYTTWNAEITRAKDDDEMTIVAPESMEQDDETLMEKDHSTKESSWCFICDQTFRTPKRLNSHIATFHGNEYSNLSCFECGKTFKSLSSLKQHTLRHKTSMLVSCSKCGIQFTKESELDAHRKNNCVRGMAMIVKCKYCERKFSNNGRYFFHLRNMHSDKITPDPTPIPRKTVDRMPRENPRSMKHTPESSTKIGGKKSDERGDRLAVAMKPLDNGLLRDQPGSPTTVTEDILCTLCFAQFQGMKSYRSHLEQCYGCGDNSANQAQPYRICRCNICATVFDSISKFLEHIQEHDRPYELSSHSCSRCRLWVRTVQARSESPQAILGD